jgi:nucleotide-binding universal stress UspA family protein
MKMKNKSTIVVTTDFSTNSKAAIRFALQIASQTPCNLVFYHCLPLMIPTGWSKEEGVLYAQTELKKGKKQLARFLKTVIKQSKKPNTPYEYDVEIDMNVDNAIIKYAQKIQADYICMCTRGAGILKKFIGTNASNLVNTSPIPVLVIPKNYRVKPITKVAYSSDFESIDHELTIVKAFTASLKAKADVYHFHYEVHETNSKETFKRIVNKYKTENVAFHIPRLYLEYSLLENLQFMLKKDKPSILVMFTQQKQNWFERIMFDSKTADMAFDIKIPLLAIRK